MNLKVLTESVLNGAWITPEEAVMAYGAQLEDLCAAADKIRRHFCKDNFDICSIINAKSGNCSEDCKFCAQSARGATHTAKYPLLKKSEILSQAAADFGKGVLRFSIVTSGKKLTDAEVDEMCEAVREIKDKTDGAVCVSFGLLDTAQFKRLKEAGASRVHNNLETSKRNFPNICSTHTFEDKIETVKAAQTAGLTVCSGGIMGIGETVEDRIDMAFALRELNIKSVPVNLLNPIPGTPMEDAVKLSVEDMRRIVAVYRFILPDAFIRLAGGRGLLADKGKSCFLSGANAAISGDMLTTAGITIKADMEMLDELGYRLQIINP